MLLPLHGGGGNRVSSFLRFSVATKSTHSKFHYSSFWPLLNSSNCQEAKKKFTNCHGLGMKQYFCSSSNATDVADMAMEAVKVAEAETGTETTVDVDEQQQQRQEKPKVDYKILAKKFMRSMGAGGVPIDLLMEFKQGRSSFKYLRLTKFMNGILVHSPNIMVPDDTYQLVRAMDELFKELAKKENEKYPASSERRVLFSISSPGKLYDYKLDLKWANVRFTVDLSTRRTEASPEHRERTFWLTLKEFHWLRHAMGEILTEHDGSQPVDEPPKYPGWLFMDGRPRSLAMARPRQAVPRAPMARPRPTMPQQQQAEPQSNAAASLAQQQQLLQVQLLSQQIQQLRQEMTTLSARPVSPSIVPVPMPTMMQMPMPQQFIQPGQFVQPTGQGQAVANGGGQEWPKMAMLVAQMLQQQMQQVPAGNGQPVPRENAMKPASQRMPMPGGNEQQPYNPGQYQRQRRKNRVPQYNDSNMDMAPALAQQQRQGKWQRQAETAGNFRQQPQQQRMKPSMANLNILEEEEEDFEQADKGEEGMALDANADMAKSGTSSAESKEAKNAIENANWGELYGWEDGKEGEEEEKQLKQQQ